MIWSLTYVKVWFWLYSQKSNIEMYKEQVESFSIVNYKKYFLILKVNALIKALTWTSYCSLLGLNADWRLDLIAWLLLGSRIWSAEYIDMRIVRMSQCRLSRWAVQWRVAVNHLILTQSVSVRPHPTRVVQWMGARSDLRSSLFAGTRERICDSNIWALGSTRSHHILPTNKIWHPKCFNTTMT